jgi:hypothetical protein
MIVLVPYGVAYFAGCAVLGFREVRGLLEMFSRLRLRS